MRRSWSAASLVFAFAACAGPTPEGFVDEYASALKAQSAERIHALSDERYREALSLEALRKELSEHGDEAQRLAALLADTRKRIQERATVELGDGEVLELVKESGRWRMAQGGFEPARGDTPEAALTTLFRAIEGRRLSWVRAVIPEASLSDYRDDARLLDHLQSIRPRVDAVKKAIGPLTPGRAVVEESYASIAYGDGLEVSFLLEGGRWRVLDVE